MESAVPLRLERSPPNGGLHHGPKLAVVGDGAVVGYGSDGEQHQESNLAPGRTARGAVAPRGSSRPVRRRTEIEQRLPEGRGGCAKNEEGLWLVLPGWLARSVGGLRVRQRFDDRDCRCQNIRPQHARTLLKWTQGVPRDARWVRFTSAASEQTQWTAEENWMRTKQRRSGRTPVLASLLILVLVAGVGCAHAQLSSTGKIELATDTFDFGTISSTDSVSQTVQVRNVGRGPLEILGVSTSCACTTVEVDSRRLGPGDATDLRVTYDPQVHDGVTGRFMRVVYVRSNDPDTPEAALTVWVTVVEPAEGADGRATGSGVNPDPIPMDGGVTSTTGSVTRTAI